MSTGYKKFLMLWAASFIAAIGSGLTSFGLGVYIFQETGLAATTGIIMLAGFLPGILLSPLAGVLADRYDRRMLMILGDGLSALGIVYIYYAIANGGASVTEIAIGVTISSVFSSLTQPAFNSTISDLLDKDEYSRSSGLTQLTSSARYLISPLLAGVLLSVSGIRLILLLDISTIILTVAVTWLVRKQLVSSPKKERRSMLEDFKAGFAIVYNHKGIWSLLLTISLMSFFFGTIQTLSGPMILSFADSDYLGMALSISASGILAVSLLLGLFSIKKDFHKILCTALFFAGIFMAGFGSRENRILICLFGFLFFAMLPFINMSLDYFIRVNVAKDAQGRVWGLIGIISQIGNVIAFAAIGQVADVLFVPLLEKDGPLAGTVGALIGVGKGRGFGFLIILSGVLLSLSALRLYRNDAIRKLEDPAGAPDLSTAPDRI